MWNATCTFPFFNSVLLSILLQSVSFNVMVTAAMLVIIVEVFHQICLKSVGPDTYWENRNRMQHFGIWSVFTWEPPTSYAKVNIAATYSEEKKDLDLVDFLFRCLSRRCDCGQKDWNSEQLANEYVCMSIYLPHVVTWHICQINLHSLF